MKLRHKSCGAQLSCTNMSRALIEHNCEKVCCCFSDGVNACCDDLHGPSPPVEFRERYPISDVVLCDHAQARKRARHDPPLVPQLPAAATYCGSQPKQGQQEIPEHVVRIVARIAALSLVASSSHLCCCSCLQTMPLAEGERRSTTIPRVPVEIRFLQLCAAMQDVLRCLPALRQVVTNTALHCFDEHFALDFWCCSRA